jgi:hypothetical protein
MTRLAPPRRASAALYPLRILAKSRGAGRRSAADRSLDTMHRDTKVNVDGQTSDAHCSTVAAHARLRIRRSESGEVSMWEVD